MWTIIAYEREWVGREGGGRGDGEEDGGREKGKQIHIETYCSLIHDGCAIADPDCANAFSLR